MADALRQLDFDPFSVLLVEDNPADAELVMRSLRESPGRPIAVLTAASLADALAQIDRQRVDAALLDLHLPDATGVDALRQLRAAYPRLPIVVITGSQEHELSTRALQLGAQDYVFKGRFDERIWARTLRHSIERARLESENRAMSEQIAATLAQRDLVLEQLPALLWTTDRDLLVTSIFGSALRRAKINPSEVIGRISPSYFGREAEDAVRKALFGERVTFDFELASRYFRAYAEPLRGDGDFTGTIGVALDITEQRAAEQAVREQADVLELAPVAIFVRDLEGKIYYWNHGAEQLYGWRRDETIGKLTHDVLQTVFPVSLAAVVAELKESGKWAGELRHKCKNGSTVVVASHWQLRPDGAELRVIEINEDVTERRRLEEQVAHAQAMEATGKLAAGVAHDFNNALTIIGSNIAIARDLAGDGRVNSALVEAQTAVERAAELTRELLAVGRRQPMRVSSVDLNELVVETERLVRPALGNAIRVRTELARELARVNADRLRLQQVLVNLVMNARDAMPDGGELILRTFCRYFLEHEKPDLPRGTYCGLEVADTGVGIPEHLRARIFEPFFSTKPKARGSGLGLATAYGTVKQSGGHMDVVSRDNSGTAFLIYLPCHPSAAPASNEALPRRAS